jgi:hypothetical protein
VWGADFGEGAQLAAVLECVLPGDLARLELAVVDSLF